VLPVHYIYIFYKRSRLPRDRYIKRRLRKSKSTTNLYSKVKILIMTTRLPVLPVRLIRFYTSKTSENKTKILIKRFI
jgi:hypothetical protein